MCILSKSGCKGTTFCAHSQTKCTKSAMMCTDVPFCAIPTALLFLFLGHTLLK